jgi:hypothetical protein
VMEICRRQKPPFFELDEGHQVACFLYDQNLDRRQEETTSL